MTSSEDVHETDTSELPAHHREWLDRVELLVTEEERTYFLGLDEEFRRKAFVREFWRVRDPVPRTAANELRERWEDRSREALRRFGSLGDDRSRFLLLHGPPGRFVHADGRVLSVCYDPGRELELWFYGGSERTRNDFAVAFFRPLAGPAGGPYRAWDGLDRLLPRRRNGLPSTEARELCAEEHLPLVRELMSERNWPVFLARLLERPESPNLEWVRTFAAGTAVVPEGAKTFEATFDVAFPGRHGQRTAVQGVVGIGASAVETRTLPGHDRPVAAFVLTGEVVRAEDRLETFRYRFELPIPQTFSVTASTGRETLVPLVFQRALRPGPAEIVVKVEDIFGRRFASVRRSFVVPSPSGLAVSSYGSDRRKGGIFALLAEADAAAERGQRTIRLVPYPDQEVQLGLVRFTTVSSGDFDRVRFLLDGEIVATKNRPPFGLELDLGPAAATHVVRVEALDEEGRQVASDELVVNRGGQRFRVRFVEPRPDRRFRESLSAVVDVEVPEGKALDRIELFLDDRRVATLYQEPFVQPILLDREGLTALRAVAFLEDGATTEETVFVNPPAHFDHIDVEIVEIFASVVDRRGDPILGLSRDDFRISEDGEPQTIRRFERVEDLPIHAVLVLDVSASMEDSLPTVAAAARTFVEGAIRPKDRVALFTFNDRAERKVPFTNDRERLAAGLETLRSFGGTALYDGIVHALHAFAGIKGQKALILLSDGEDETSAYTLESAIQTAQRTGVAVSVIGLAAVEQDRAARKALVSLAEATGGRSFFIEALAELPEIYESIEAELRSQYLISYQSTSAEPEGEFRRIEISVDGAGEVRAPAGYYP